MATTVVKAAYWPSWNFQVHDFSHSPIDPSLFTHINYAYVPLDTATFKLDVSVGSASLMRDFDTSLHSIIPPIKTMLSIGGDNDKPNFPVMASSPTNRKVFIDSTIEVARKYNFDGLDLFWLSPKDSTDMTNLGLLLKEWRAAIDIDALARGTSSLLLTAAVYYSAKIQWDEPHAYPTASINQNMDWVNVQCYDYYGSWDTSKTGAHAALYDPSPDNNVSTKYGLKTWIDAGVLAEKLVMGFTLHARTWKLLHPDTHGIGAPAKGVGQGDLGIMTFSEVEKFNKENGAKVVHDKQTGSTYSYAGTTWISYNDDISAKFIIKFAKDLGLRGYFFSEIYGDSNWKISRKCSTIWEQISMELETAPRLPLYKAALNGVWPVGSDASVHVSMFRENVIHLVAGKGHATELLKTIVDKPHSNQDLLIGKDTNGNTALFLAAMSGNLKETEILVQKEEALLTIADSNGTFPVYVAAMYGHKETIAYLINKTKGMIGHNFRGENGVYLLNLLITAGFYDMAGSLLDDFPTLAYQKDIYNTIPLQTLAKLPIYLWQRDGQEKPHQLIGRICQAMLDEALATNTAASNFFWDPLLTAVKLGNHEIVIEIINKCPYIVWFTDDDERTIYHYAVLHRHEKIFNLIWKLGSNKYRIANMKGTDNNNILHLAAKLGDNTTSRVSGAVLHMQRELQWYEKVKNLVQVSFQEEKDKDDRTPKEVFTIEHKDLVKEGEAWMQKTASASTLVAALIVTVVFAAAFTVPGGNDSDTGLPIFLQRPAFIVFAISNAIALFSSSTSLMMFLGILNSRYSEGDFLHSLPSKLIIGLCTLFLSILCMLIAFGAALQLYLGHLLNLVVIPIVLGMCIPAILFVFLQFPLLIEISYSTYGPSIFRDEVNST